MTTGAPTRAHRRWTYADARMKPAWRQWVTQQRWRLGISGREAARRAGMHELYWSLMERGQLCNPKGRTLKAIAVALRLDVRDVVEMFLRTVPWTGASPLFSGEDLWSESLPEPEPASGSLEPDGHSSQSPSSSESSLASIGHPAEGEADS